MSAWYALSRIAIRPSALDTVDGVALPSRWLSNRPVLKTDRFVELLHGPVRVGGECQM